MGYVRPVVLIPRLNLRQFLSHYLDHKKVKEKFKHFLLVLI